MKKIFSFSLIFLLISNFYLFPQITINGDMSEAEYSVIATKQNSNNGFGSNIDVSKIYAYFDNSNSLLYLGIEGKLNTSSNDGIGLWIGLSGSGSPSGTSAGSSLGGISSAGHYMEDASNPNFRADFEVDYMFAINPGSSSTNCYVNAASRVGTPAGVYLGNCGQSGASTNYSTTGTVFANGHTITFAFNNAGTSNKGFEIRIPYGAISASASMSIATFTFVVSSTAFFSDVTVPGNRTGGNPGFNPNFNGMSGGPYNSGDVALPVELASFNAAISGNFVTLNWKTVTEINNLGFEIQRISQQAQNENWETIGFVQGSGTTNSPKSYSFVDKTPLVGKSLYRLKQIDIDGSVNYSNVIEVEFNNLVPKEFSLYQNYPNPFNPSTVIRYQLPKNSNVSLKVYNILGNEIANLVDEYKEAGNYEVEFNLDKINLSSGVYFYKLQTGDFVDVKKMVVVQ